MKFSGLNRCVNPNGIPAVRWFVVSNYPECRDKHT